MNNLTLSNFILLKTTPNKAVIFKISKGYTKCIYISLIDDCIEIRVDKVFDEKSIYKGIERLMLGKKYFTNIDESLMYIKRNIAI